eukprot:6180055-Pleurochrysis_carterae.AAC.3
MTLDAPEGMPCPRASGRLSRGSDTYPFFTLKSPDAPQVLVMYGDVFSRASLPGSLYRDGCPAMSTFALDAVCSSAFILLNVCLTIIGWTATYPRYLRKHAALMLGLHLAASAATGLSAYSGMPVSGCLLSLPLLALVLLATGGLAARCALVSSHEARQVLRTRCT